LLLRFRRCVVHSRIPFCFLLYTLPRALMHSSDRFRAFLLMCSFSAGHNVQAFPLRCRLRQGRRQGFYDVLRRGVHQQRLLRRPQSQPQHADGAVGRDADGVHECVRRGGSQANALVRQRVRPRGHRRPRRLLCVFECARVVVRRVVEGCSPLRGSSSPSLPFNDPLSTIAPADMLSGLCGGDGADAFFAKYGVHLAGASEVGAARLAGCNHGKTLFAIK
jgi:hypothetical protein